MILIWMVGSILLMIKGEDVEYLILFFEWYFIIFVFGIVLRVIIR